MADPDPRHHADPMNPGLQGPDGAPDEQDRAPATAQHGAEAGMIELPAFVISRVNALTPRDTMLSEETAAPTFKRAIVPSSGNPC